MYEQVEKSLFTGGLLTALGVGNLYGFWHGVLAAGLLLFALAFFLMAVELFTPELPELRGRG